MTVEIIAAQVSKLDLAEGEIALVRVPRSVMTNEFAENLCAALRDALAPIGAKAIILSNDIELEEITREELQSILNHIESRRPE